MGAEHSVSQEKSLKENEKLVIVRAKHDFTARRKDELSLKKGMKLMVVDSSDDEWWTCQALDSVKGGYVPASYVEIIPNDSLIMAPWYHGTITKDAANAVMKFAETGSFLIRDSLTLPDQFVLVAKNDSPQHPVCNYKIKKDSDGKFFISDKLSFKKLEDLIQHYSENGGLKVRLKWPMAKGVSVKREEDVWEIKSSSVAKLKKLGEGNFGEVWKGAWSLPSGGERLVAIKTLKRHSMSTEKFLQEAEVMKGLHHKNIVTLLAICHEEMDMFIVTEFMDKGDLLSVLRGSEGQRLDSNDFLAICHQICAGMEYLESHEFVHRDLAARNVLISTENVVKLADFGLAKILENEDYYTGNEETCFPIRWTAPEAITTIKFSIKSDVWSFGITCYEIYTRGDTPYFGKRNSEILALLQTGYRLPRPESMARDIYALLLRCWNEDSHKRPSFRLMEEELSRRDDRR